MSRPAQRPVPQRTVPCPTCQASARRPCYPTTAAEIARAMDTNVWTVRPHLARRKAEAAYEAEQEG